MSATMMDSDSNGGNLSDIALNSKLLPVWLTTEEALTLSICLSDLDGLISSQHFFSRVHGPKKGVFNLPIYSFQSGRWNIQAIGKNPRVSEIL